MKDFSPRVKAMIAAHFGIDEDRVTPEAVLVADLGANSLDLVEITMGLEQEFDLTIRDVVAEEFQTIADIEAYLRNALQASGSWHCGAAPPCRTAPSLQMKICAYPHLHKA